MIEAGLCDMCSYELEVMALRERWQALRDWLEDDSRAGLNGKECCCGCTDWPAMVLTWMAERDGGKRC